jgi:NADPH2:quinone reductase
VKAITVRETADRPVLELSEIPAPEPGPTELLVRVCAAGMNRADLVLPKVHFTAQGTTAIVAGYEMSGTVIAMGGDCRGISIGDRVMAPTRAAFAEQCLVDYRLAMHVPTSIDLATAAALPAWYVTAHNALTALGNLRRGESVLIQGATSGVGIAAAQMARILGAGRIIGVSRTNARWERLRTLGFDALIVADEGWPAKVKAETAGNGADLIIDLVGGGALSGNVQCAAITGRIVAVGRMGGEKDMLDLDVVAFKRLTIRGATFRSRTIEEQAQTIREFAQQMLPLIEAGTLKPVIDSVYPPERASAAQEHVRRNEHFGKTLISFEGMSK